MSWQSIARRLEVGALVKDGAYRITEIDAKGITAERVATGSRVRASRAMIEKTAARLEAGEFIPRRGISYTVAIETLVVLALGRSIRETTRDGARGYVGKGRA